VVQGLAVVLGADQVWELWDAGIITDGLAAIAWLILATPDRQEEITL